MLKTVVTDKVVELLLFSLMVGMFSMFLQECMQYQMILRRYYLYLVYWWRKKRLKILKPLGLCVYCYNTWVSLIIYLMLFEFNIIELILFIGGSYFGVELTRQLKK